MGIKEFYNELENHDWFYHFSDDHGAWCAGVANENRLRKIAEESPEHKKLFYDFGKHYFSGESFGKPKAPKPIRPT